MWEYQKTSSVKLQQRKEISSLWSCRVSEKRTFGVRFWQKGCCPNTYVTLTCVKCEHMKAEKFVLLHRRHSLPTTIRNFPDKTESFILNVVSYFHQKNFGQKLSVHVTAHMSSFWIMGCKELFMDSDTHYGTPLHPWVMG